MNNKQVLNDEFLKSIDTNYEFSDKPISHTLQNSHHPGEIKSELEKLNNQIAKLMVVILKITLAKKEMVFGDGNFQKD